jgi:hypothetical protein
VQPGSASTLRRALGTTVTAAASRMPAPAPKSKKSNEAIVSEANGRMIR